MENRPDGSFLLNYDNYIDRSIILNGCYEREQLDKFCTLIRQQGISQFIDIGANIGLYVVKVGGIENINTIHAFEPVSANRNQLHANVLLNNLNDKVKIFPYALSKNSGTVRFLKNKGDSTGISRVKIGNEDSKFLERFEEIEVKTKRLDELIYFDKTKIAIKIDVEGHELDVLSGMTGLLSKNNCILQVESFVDKRKKVRDMLADYGYRMIYSIGSDYYYSNFPDHSNNVIDFKKSINCYVINLDRSINRLQYISHIFHGLDLDFERISAIDGKLLSEEELNHLTEKSTWQPKLTASEVGYFLSHRECLRRIAEGNEPWGAIFEDDVVLSPKIRPLLQSTDWMPDGADIIKLDTHKTICTLGRRKLINISRKNYYLSRLLSTQYGACSYIISKQCAKKLLDLVQDINAPIDVIYFDSNHGLLHQLNIQQVFPALVMQTGISSTVEKNKKIKRKLSLHRKLIREIRRIYHRNIRATWQSLTRGYYTGKIPFK